MFTEEKDLYVDNGGEMNFLLEGDNLASLELLSKTHKGLVDVVYIDPPYNTGNTDFTYDDDYVEKEDAYKHSKWLSFMKRRLELAHEVMSNDGILFMSIDDKEQAALKILTDEIFGEDNFIVALPRQTKKSGKTTGSFSKNHDYVLVYTKLNKDVFVMEEHIDDNYKYEDEFVDERGKYKLNQTLDYDSLSYSKSLDYPLEIDGEIFYPGGSKEKHLERQSGKHKRADWAWRWNKEMFKYGYENGFVVIKRKKDGTARIYTKTYLNAKIEKRKSKGMTEYFIKYVHKTKPLSSIELTLNKYSNDNAKKDLSVFNLQDEFDYSKPVDLIKRLISCHYNPDAYVLDFFAGSGTTGQAILELNKERGGNRKFILCTNNQNNICREITYKRVSSLLKGFEYKKEYMVELLEEKLTKSALKKIDKTFKEIERIESNNEFVQYKTESKDGYLRLFGINTKNEYFNPYKGKLKYLKVEYVPTEDLFYEEYADELLNYIPALVELENGINLDDNKEFKIILTDEELEEFIRNDSLDKSSICRVVYLGHDVLTSSLQEKYFKENGIEVKIIPNYYYNELER
ncbi:type III restriction-modification system: methylase [Bacillus cereus NC7401]|nr:type III restriction-modification system: methylase [Bacillus cereus NC7401]